MIVLFLAWCVYVHASYVNNIWKLFVWMRNAGARSFAPNASECEIGQLWGYECDCLIQCASHFYVCFCFTLWVCVCVYLFISFPLSLHIIARFITSYSETVMCIFWFFVTVCILRFYLVFFSFVCFGFVYTAHIFTLRCLVWSCSIFQPFIVHTDHFNLCKQIMYAMLNLKKTTTMPKLTERQTIIFSSLSSNFALL